MDVTHVAKKRDIEKYGYTDLMVGVYGFNG